MKLSALRRLDAFGVVLALLFALPTLTYPFGRDQALFFYIGREWLNGALPYRDSFDNKPPGIFALDAFTILVLGKQQWTVRAVEILGALAMAWLVTLAVARDAKRQRGELGAVALFVVGWYFTAFDFWDTAQTEFWESLALVASLVVAQRVRRTLVAAAASGALVGVAVLFKFPAALVGVVATVIVVLRAVHANTTWQTRLRGAAAALLANGLGAASAVGVVGAYFAARGGYREMFDALFGYLWYYHTHRQTPPGSGLHLAKVFWDANSVWATVVAASWLCGTVSAAQRRAWVVVRGALGAAAALAIAVASVVVQRRFHPYYWVVTTPFLALAAAYGVFEGMRRWPKSTLLAACSALLAGYAWAPPWSVNASPTSFRDATRGFWRYARGDIDREAYLDLFSHSHEYDYRTEETIGTRLRDRARPGDELIVRNFDPAIYLVSGMKCPSRFASDLPLWFQGMEYRRDEWRAEHERASWARPPRFVVTGWWLSDDIASLEARGYRRVEDLNGFVVFERP